jgi:hypothetical protein
MQVFILTIDEMHCFGGNRFSLNLDMLGKDVWIKEALTIDWFDSHFTVEVRLPCLSCYIVTVRNSLEPVNCRVSPKQFLLKVHIIHKCPCEYSVTEQFLFWWKHKCFLWPFCTWVKQTFEEADKNGDGLLNIEEIHQLMHKLNVSLPRRKVRQMFQVCFHNCIGLMGGTQIINVLRHIKRLFCFAES